MKMRASMERGEARMWLANNPLHKEAHSYFFKALVRIERLKGEDDIGACDSCERSARYKCSGCNLALYCCKEHQERDWTEHKSKCKIIRREIARDFISPDPNEFAGKCSFKTAAKPFCVLLIMQNAPHSVFMSKADMMDYASFLVAIQSVIPSCREMEDHGWQQWQTVRGAWRN